MIRTALFEFQRSQIAMELIVLTGIIKIRTFINIIEVICRKITEQDMKIIKTKRRTAIVGENLVLLQNIQVVLDVRLYL